MEAKKKNKWMAWLLTLCLLLGLVPMEALATGETPTEYGLTVSGTKVTSDNADDVLGDADGGATVTYDDATKTLTLDNATIHFQNGNGISCMMESDFTIVLKGKNLISGGENSFAAVSSHNNLILTGNGSLIADNTAFGLYCNKSITIQGGAEVDLTSNYFNEEAAQSCSAVRALDGLTVDGATLHAKNTGSLKPEFQSYFETPGISTSLTAQNGAKVNISSVNGDAIPVSLVVSGEGTEVVASSESSEHYGISIEGGDFIISEGATVIASGGKGATKKKPNLTGYENPVILAGENEGTATEVNDLEGTEYHTNKYLKISPKQEEEPEPQPTPYDLWVGGVQVTSANAGDVLEGADTGATVTYDAATATLTLNNASIYKLYQQENKYSGICSNLDKLNLKLEGSSTVDVCAAGNNVADSETTVYGIYAKNMTVSGTGSLTARSNDYGVSVENMVVNSGSVTGESSGNNDVSISVDVLQVTGGNVSGKSTGNYASGISTNVLRVSGGSVSGKSTGIKSDGIDAYDMTVKNGSVTGKSTREKSSGIKAENMTVSGGEVIATADHEQSYYGIQIYEGNLKVSGGRITAKGGEAAIAGFSVDYDTEAEAKAAKLIQLPNTYLSANHKIYTTTVKYEWGYYTASTIAPANGTPSFSDDTFTGAVREITLSASNNPVVKAQSVAVKAVSKQIAAGKKVQLSAVVAPTNTSNKAVTWSTSNKKYATVDATGKVTFKKAGAGKSVTITATAADGSGRKGSVKIKIMKHAVKSVKLKAAKTVKAGKKVKVKATVKTTGKNANKKLQWSSSNTNYATVSSKGIVKTKKAGKGKTVKITAVSTDGTNKKKTVKIKIK